MNPSSFDRGLASLFGAMSTQRWQFVWWGLNLSHSWRLPSWRGHPYSPPGTLNEGCIYSATYRFGPIELRRWASKLESAQG